MSNTHIFRLGGLIATAISAVALTVTAAHGQARATQPAPQSVQALLRDLSAETGRAMDAAPELVDSKVLMVRRGVLNDETLRGLAMLLGAEWRDARDADGAAVRRLRRTAATEEWRSSYLSARELSERDARNAYRDHMLANWQTAMREIDVPEERRVYQGAKLNPPAARFVATLPPAALSQLAEWIADQMSVHAGASTSRKEVYNRNHPAVVFEYRRLPAASQERLLQMVMEQEPWSGELPADFMAQRALLAQSRIGLGAMNAPILVQIFAPDQAAPRSWAAFGDGWGSNQLAEVADESLTRRLEALPTPGTALLGARLGEGARPTPAVRIDPQLAQRRVIPPPAPLRVELLRWLAEETGLTVLADHCTLSDRASLAPRPLGEVLAAASQTFGTVFRQEGDVLLARRAFWPDDELREFPAPHPDDWIAELRAGQLLTFEDVATIAAASEARRARLALYSDGPVQLKPYVSPSWDVTQGALLAALTELPDEVREQLRSKEGVPLADLPAEVRSAIRNEIMRYPSMAGTTAALNEFDQLHLAVRGSVTDPRVAELYARLGQRPPALAELGLWRVSDDGGEPVDVRLLVRLRGVK